MKTRTVLWTVAFLLLGVHLWADEPCQFLGSKTARPNYESGGPYVIDHFKFNKDRTDLRAFLWKHWHNHIAAVAEARIKTIDAGTPTALYIIQPDAKGTWGIDFEIYSPMNPPMYPRCARFHADSMIRVPIQDPGNDNYQTLGYYPNDKLPKALVPDSADIDPRDYWIVLAKSGEPASAPF